MDFDLFEQEDDDILSSLCIIQTEEKPDYSNPYPTFNCTGEDSKNSVFSADSFVKNNYLYNLQKNNDEFDIELTSYKFTVDSLEIPSVYEYIISQIRSNIQTLFVNSKNLQYIQMTESIFNIRREVTNALFLFRLENTYLDWTRLRTDLKNIRILLNRISSPETLKSIYLSYTSKGNETNNASYHLLHGLLEWQFLDLLILHKLSLIGLQCDTEKEVPDRNEDFDLQYNIILRRMLIYSVLLYNKRNSEKTFYNCPPFPCTCIKESWLLLQLLIEKCIPYQDFWTYFNRAIEKLREDFEHFGLAKANIDEFIIWILNGIVTLQGYNTNGIFVGNSNTRITENFSIVENSLESFLNSNPSEDKLRKFLCCLSLILEWWPPKAQISMSLWEYFHKKMHSSFFLSGSAPNSLAVVSSSGKGYLGNIKTILDRQTPDLELSSYSIFLMLLGRSIEKLMSIGQNNQIQKIFGRIYSKFGPSKILAFTETGIHHLIELFLVLGLTANLNEIATRLRDKLLSTPLDKLSPSRQICLIKGHIAFMLLFCERGLDITEYVQLILDQVANINNDVNILRLIAESLPDFLKTSPDFTCGENKLIDSWLTHYLNTASPIEQERLLETIHSIFEKIQSYSSLEMQNNSNKQIILKSLEQHILPHVRQSFLTGHSIYLPLLASDFCIVGTDTRNRLEFQKLFKYFIDANCSDTQLQPKFLLSILFSNKRSLVDQDVIIKIWLKSLVLLTSNNDDVTSLTKIVVNLSDFGIMCGLGADELLTAKEPLCVFISAVGKNYASCQESSKRSAISEKFNSTLLGFDKWLSEKNEKNEITFRFYSFIAIVIYNCAAIVYSRSQITCFFHIAMSRFIIPCPIQTGKQPEPKLAQIVHKIWPVIIQGIGTLNYKTDPYLVKTLTDLIVKWTPHLKISNNSKIVSKPFIALTKSDNAQFIGFVFEKLAATFLSTQRRQADNHSCLVITIFKEVTESIIDDENKLKSLLQTVAFIFLEHIMMVDSIVPSRNMLFELFKFIFKSNVYQNSSTIKEVFVDKLKLITNKHLSYFTFFYFELLTLLVNLCPEIVKKVTDYLQNEIKIVEQKRGSGEDGHLRSSFEKLKGALMASLSKRGLL